MMRTEKPFPESTFPDNFPWPRSTDDLPPAPCHLSPLSRTLGELRLSSAEAIDRLLDSEEGTAIAGELRASVKRAIDYLEGVKK